MAGMQFEYDEQGGTFYYFLLSFTALILIPSTYYFWPGKSVNDEQRKKKQCYCEPCQSKKHALRSNQPRRRFQKTAIKVVLIIGWIFFIYIAYKTSQVELDFTEFDPYAELEIDRGASVADIKKAYRKLSMVFHPDRETGDARRFMKITKAHDALTNEESRKNWEEYGNPDGPGATQVGIALPKWIVEKQNSIWVLGLYALIFMIILPVCVGTWWYRSIKYSAQQVLIDTTRLYYSMLRKSPNMMLKRVVMVLAASYEFWKRFNSEIIERPSDNTEIPELIRDLPSFTQNNREMPFCLPYCVKVRALLEAHFNRKELPQNTLEIDKQCILKKCPYLLNEILCLAQQLYLLAQSERVQWKLSLDTVENIMKASQMIIQGIHCRKSPLLQLPHIAEDMLRHFVTKRRNIRSFKQLVSMKEEDRRALLRQLTDSEYRDVMNVLSALPNVLLEIRCEVKGEEDKTVTAGSLVTVTIRLERQNMMDDDLNDSQTAYNIQADYEDDGIEEKEEEDAEEEEEEIQNSPETPVHNKAKWVKNKKKKGGAPKKGGKKNKHGTGVTVVYKTVGSSHDDKKDVNNDKKDVNNASNNMVVATLDDDKDKDKERGREREREKTDKDKDKKKSSSQAVEQLTDEERVSDDGGSSDDERGGADGVDDGKGSEDGGGGGGGGGDDDEEWMAFQQETKKENLLETKSKETHLVHCPHFLSDKYEWWWLYLADIKKKLLVSGPIQICTLREVEEKELRFPAPLKPGNYQYTVILRSDSYLGVDQSQTLKLDVKEAKKIVETHPQWDISDDEEKKDDRESGSDVDSDDESSNDDN